MECDSLLPARCLSHLTAVGDWAPSSPSSCLQALLFRAGTDTSVVFSRSSYRYNQGERLSAAPHSKDHRTAKGTRCCSPPRPAAPCAAAPLSQQLHSPCHAVSAAARRLSAAAARWAWRLCVGERDAGPQGQLAMLHWGGRCPGVPPTRAAGARSPGSPSFGVWPWQPVTTRSPMASSPRTRSARGTAQHAVYIATRLCHDEQPRPSPVSRCRGRAARRRRRRRRTPHALLRRRRSSNPSSSPPLPPPSTPPPPPPGRARRRRRGGARV
jgi:hypothetical protein